MSIKKNLYKYRLIGKILWDKFNVNLILRIKNTLLWNYYYSLIHQPKVYNKKIEYSPKIYNQIKQELINNGFKVVDYNIDINDFKKFFRDSNYHQYSNYYRSCIKTKSLIEKALEHYLAAKFLNLSEKDIYIDIASAFSPSPEIYKRLYRCQVYRQDLKFPKRIIDIEFPKGIHVKTIGGDVGNIPIQNDFASKLALHCSFETFEQQSDINFIIEANRILKKDGVLCILPLYLYKKYVIETNPANLPRQSLLFDRDAIICCVKRKGRHFRWYDIPHLISRIKDNLNNLDLTIYFIKNEEEISKTCYLKLVAIFVKK